MPPAEPLPPDEFRTIFDLGLHHVMTPEQEVAQKRAVELLAANLSNDEKRSLQMAGWIDVTGGKSGQRYRVAANGGVAMLDAEQGIHQFRPFCVHALGVMDRPMSHDLRTIHLPTPDRVLAMLLCIRHDEKLFLEKATPHLDPRTCPAYRAALRATGARAALLHELDRMQEQTRRTDEAMAAIRELRRVHDLT